MCVCVVSQAQIFVTLWTVAHQASLSMEFSRHEYWSIHHFLHQGIFLTQGSNPCLLHRQVDSLSLVPHVKWKLANFIFLGSKITVDSDCSHVKMLAPWKESYDKPRQIIQKQKHHFVAKSI